jgi:hypothetical protein
MLVGYHHLDYIYLASYLQLVPSNGFAHKKNYSKVVVYRSMIDVSAIDKCWLQRYLLDYIQYLRSYLQLVPSNGFAHRTPYRLTRLDHTESPEDVRQDETNQ